MRCATYDTKCLDLANDFLEEEEVYKNLAPAYQMKLAGRLAGDIQGAIEDFIDCVADEAKEVLSVSEV
jgi:hypothetical protein